MAYAHLDYEKIGDPTARMALRRADWYLFDAYGIFRALPPAGGDGGGGNFSIALVLLCVIDGLSKVLWPNDEQEQRFKRLIRCRLHWGAEGKGKWLERANAAKQLYAEFRNPLVHELAQDKITPSRPAGFVEPVVGKWGNLPAELQDISVIDALPTWDDRWPVLAEDEDEQGSPRLKLVASGLYWAVKKLANEVAAEFEAPDHSARRSTT